MNTVPIITIDGPGGAGKGTISLKVANALSWHYLDSGALYRVLAYFGLQKGLDLSNEEELMNLAHTLPVEFTTNDSQKTLLEGIDVSSLIREPIISQAASRISALPGVRQALLDRQHQFAQPPGLVTDGRDMGTVVFPSALLKIFLTATPEERAERRYRQLQAQGIAATLAGLLAGIRERDERDSNRDIAPLKPAKDALLLDTTNLSIKQVTQYILTELQQRLVTS